MIQRYLEKYPQEMPHEYFSILKAIICIKSVFFLWCLQSAVVFKCECGFETFNTVVGHSWPVMGSTLLMQLVTIYICDILV